jgi:chromatin remodeling complex protein RSC6
MSTSISISATPASTIATPIKIAAAKKAVVRKAAAPVAPPAVSTTAVPTNDVPTTDVSTTGDVKVSTDVTTEVKVPVVEDDSTLPERIATRLSNTLDKVSSIETTCTAEFKTIKADIKALQKDLQKFFKIANNRKTKPRNVRVSNPDSESGFKKPVAVSKQMADFLAIPHDTLIPRLDVTRKINKYIKDNELQNPEDRRKIVPDAKLHALLGTTAETPLTYFNYQKYMKTHFLETPKAVAVVNV